MQEALNWVDCSYKSKDRNIYVSNEINIPGVRLFATHKVQNAISPLPPHYHEDAFEITFLVKGSMIFHTEHSEYDITGGDVFVSFPNEVHSTNNRPISLNHQYWLQIDSKVPEDFLFLNPAASAELIKNLKAIDRHVIATDNLEMRTILEKAYTLLASDGDRYLIAGYLSVFFQLLVLASKEERYSSAPDIQAGVQYIKEHIKESISLEDIARHCNLSTSQFKQKFRRVTGIPPRDYINREKIEYSKTMLLTGTSITKIALDLGFNTSSYFSSVFKKYTMTTPREYMHSNYQHQ